MESSQLVIPASFIDLYVVPGRVKLKAPREEIAARYELCEDLASSLTDHARSIFWDHGAAEPDVLERVHRGLAGSESGVTPAEAQWVTRRLAELLDWPWSPIEQEGELP